MTHTIRTAFVLVAAWTTGAAAQSGTYRRTPGDTLRYGTTMSGVIATEGAPSGPMQISMSGESIMVVAFAPADTVRLWLEKGSMKMTSPMGETSPPLAAMLNKVWIGRMAPKGKVEMTAAPALPTDHMPGGDIVSGFLPHAMQIFMVLPAEPLRVGLSWPDSTEARTKIPNGGETSSRTTTTYTVVKDSTLDGERVFVIEKISKLVAEANASMDTGGTTMHMKMNMTGDVTGRIYFAPERGLMLKQTDLSVSKGTQHIEGAMSMSLTNSQRIENTVTLVR